MKKGKQGMTREQAAALYDNLKKSMEKKYGRKGLEDLMAEEQKKTKGKSPAALAGLSAQSPVQRNVSLPPRTLESRTVSGRRGAFLLLGCMALVKLTVAVVDVSGAFDVKEAEATLQARNGLTSITSAVGPKYSKEEVRVLKELDARRSDLSKREERLEIKEEELEQRDRDFAVKLTELRELTEVLKADRVQNDRKRAAQLDQLANVYSSMNPKEAAALIEQLDVVIALQLLERMPEKRIGQILALMSPERALEVTRMLTEKGM